MKVCVFGSSSKNTQKEYCDAAFRLGNYISENGFVCVNGGGRYGVMGACTEGCFKKNSGKVIGIIHQKFIVDYGENPYVSEMILSKGDDLDHRKRLLMDYGDCIIAMPGGVGTFDELRDVVSSKALKMKDLEEKPICIVNINGYYDGFVLQLNKAFESGLLYHNPEGYIHVEFDELKALDWCHAEYLKLKSTPKAAPSSTNRLLTRKSNDTNFFQQHFSMLSAITIGLAVGYMIGRHRLLQ